MVMSYRTIQILLESCLQTCMTYTIAVCTVNNSWRWTEELSEICRVSFQNKFEKLVHLVGFIIRICHAARSHERKEDSINYISVWSRIMSRVFCITTLHIIKEYIFISQKQYRTSIKLFYLQQYIQDIKKK
jgi:hypothetical protein